MKMQRQFGMELLTIPQPPISSKIARNGRSTNLVSPSPFLKLKPPFHLWRICTTPIQNGNSLLATRFFSNPLLHNLPTKSPVAIRNRISVRAFNSFDRRRRFTTNRVVLGLIAINVAVFILWQFANPLFMMKYFSISVQHLQIREWETLITCAFSHRHLLNLFMNMVGLYFFGTSIGERIGPGYLVKLYLGGGIAGSIFYLVHKAFLAAPLQGASGAVYAIMLLDFFLFPSKNILILIPLVGWDISRQLSGDPRAPGSFQFGGAMVAAFEWFRHRKGRFRRF